MSDEPNNPEANLQAREASSGASNSIPQSTEQTESPALSPPVPPAEHNPNKTSILRAFWNHTKVAWLLFGEILTLYGVWLYGIHTVLKLQFLQVER